MNFVKYMKYISLLPDPIAITIKCKNKKTQRFVAEYQSFIEKRHMTQKYQWAHTHTNAHNYSKLMQKANYRFQQESELSRMSYQQKKFHNIVNPNILPPYLMTEFKIREKSKTLP